MSSRIYIEYCTGLRYIFTDWEALLGHIKKGQARVFKDGERLPEEEVEKIKDLLCPQKTHKADR